MTMGLIVTSRMASEADASGPLMELLIERGAALGLESSSSSLPDRGDMNALDAPLANHAPRSAEELIALAGRGRRIG